MIDWCCWVSSICLACWTAAACSIVSVALLSPASFWFVEESFHEVFLEDIGVCFYVLWLQSQFGWVSGGNLLVHLGLCSLLMAESKARYLFMLFFWSAFSLKNLFIQKHSVISLKARVVQRVHCWMHSLKFSFTVKTSPSVSHVCLETCNL